MSNGPVQILVVGFDEPKFEGKIMDELTRLRDHDIVRLIGLLVVYKHDDGTIERLTASDLSENEELSELAAALAGLDVDGEAASAKVPSDQENGDVWYIDDAIPPGSAAAIAVLEHRWATGL